MQPTLVRILVVDDFGPIRRFVCEALGKRQHLRVVGEALDGLEAIQKAVELKPELILLVGLIQRAIEARGVPTVSVTVARDVTEAIKVPRALFLPWPMGHHFGAPFHRDLQRRVVLAALGLLETSDEPGTILDIPIKWADVRRESKALTEQGRKL